MEDNTPELEIEDPETLEFVDFTQFLTERGMSIKAVAKDNSLETMDGITHVGRYAMKWQINAVCHALNSDDTRTVFKLLNREYITVRYLNPEYGKITAIMFLTERPAAFRKRIAGEVFWDGMSFTLIER